MKSKHLTLFFALLAFSFIHTNIQAQWTAYQTPPFSINGRIKSVSKGTNTLIVHTDNFYRSHDFGDTWQIVHPAITGLRDLAVQKDVLWANDGGNIYKSTDDGTSWQKLTNTPPQSYIDAMAVGSSDTLFLALRDSFSLISYNGGNTWVRKAKFEMFRTSAQFNCVFFNNAVYASDDLSGFKFDVQQNKTVTIFGGRFEVTGVFNRKLFIYSDNTFRYYSSDGANWKNLPYTYGVPIAVDAAQNIYVSANYIVNDTLFKNTLPSSLTDSRLKKFNFQPLLYNDNTSCPMLALKDSTTFLVSNPINGIWKTGNKGATYDRKVVTNKALFVKKLVKHKATFYASTDQGIFSTDSTFSRWQLVNKGAYSFGTDYKLYADENFIWTNRINTMMSKDGGQTWIPARSFNEIRRNAVGYVVDLDDYWYLSKDTLKTLQFVGMATLNSIYSEGHIFQMQNNKYNWLDPQGQLQQSIYVLSIGTADIRSMVTSGNKWYIVDTQGFIHISENKGQTWAITTNRPVVAFDFLPVRSQNVRMKAFGDTLVFNFLRYLRFVNNRGQQSVMISGKEQGEDEFEADIADTNLHLVGNKIWVRKIQNVKIQTLTGSVYLDANNNRRRDPTEIGFAKTKVITKPDGNVAITDTLGRFEMVGDANFTDSISVLPDVIKYYKLNPNARLVQNFIKIDSNNLGIYLLPTAKDVAVSLSNNMVARPGFPLTMTIHYRNVGSVISNGTVKLRYGNKLTVQSTSSQPSFTSPQYLEWNYAALNSGQERAIKIVFKTATDAAIRSTIMNSVHIATIEADTFLGNNTDTLLLPVLGSFDPNDKQVVINKGQTPPSVIDKNTDLVYTIRFQNTGNYRADAVKVVDTLSDKLDLTTLRIIAASHSYDLTIKNKNTLVFDFNPIALPDSNTNEQGSHGYIRFAIKPKAALTNNEVIRNKAFIFFDFNSAIITNTTETKNTLTSISVPPSVAQELSVFPNPNSGILSFRLPNRVGQDMKIEIYGLDGHLLMSNQQTAQSQNDLNISFLSNGLYLLHVNVGNEHWISRFHSKK